MSVVASMFPPDSTTATGPAAGHPSRQQRSEPDGARAFHEELRSLDAEHERFGDLLVRHLRPVSSSVPLEDRRRRARPYA